LMSIKEYLTPLEWILPNIDVIIDGQFIEEQKDLNLKWRGSKNQRVIDVKKSLENKEVVLYKV
jgi:anaerobic ribonucleoside-triphosphate reductase activating protein